MMSIIDKQLYISSKIRTLHKFYHVGVKDILKKHDVCLNSSGEKLVVNLTIVHSDIIDEVFAFIKCSEAQEVQLQSHEAQMDAIKNEHFTE